MRNTEPDNSVHANIVHVAVAVIVNSEKKVLIAKRPDHVHQGGFWEFPGGKVEQGETVYEALCREIQEELQIQIGSARPLIKVTHHYGDKSVLLDVWLVTQFNGIAQEAEGQSLAWQSIDALMPDEFPAANRKIISALQLPDTLLITGDFSDLQDFSDKLDYALQTGVKLVQLRCKAICDADTYQAIVHLSKTLCDARKAKLLLNSDPELANELQLGLHLNSRDLYKHERRPISSACLLSVSCHNLDDLQQAEKLQVDFALLSPVKQTTSHPNITAMGWKTFENLTSAVNVPVFALGGMRTSDLNDARQVGAQGIAAISALWGGK